MPSAGLSWDVGLFGAGVAVDLVALAGFRPPGSVTIDIRHSLNTNSILTFVLVSLSYTFYI